MLFLYENAAIVRTFESRRAMWSSVGELRSLALQFEWGPKKLDQMEFILGYFDEIAIDSPDLVKTYATIDAYAQKIGKSPGKNDLWIAATTIQFGARLLTTDRDFDWLDPIFLKRDLISSRV